MAEVAFAKSFLTSLDSRPPKLSADHVEDPRTFPPRPPYILPRMPRPMSQPPSPATPGHERTITLSLRSLRNPPLDLALPAQPLSTSILDVKAAVAEQTRIPVEKIRILYAKRPLQDSKVLKELVTGDTTTTLELAVMVIGGAAAAAAAAVSTSTEQQAAEEGEKEGEKEGERDGEKDGERDEELETDAFWGELRAFLAQRLRDEGRAEELSGLFRASWEASRESS